VDTNWIASKRLLCLVSFLPLVSQPSEEVGQEPNTGATQFGATGKGGVGIHEHKQRAPADSEEFRGFIDPNASVNGFLHIGHA